LAVLVRTWNLFHGNALPPERRAFLREMIDLVSADDPDVVCLQEVPAWALGKLESWSGMQSFGAVAARPRLLSADLGRTITVLNHGLLRSVVAGEALAILVARRHTAAMEPTRPVGPKRVFVSVRLEGGPLVGDFHLTGGAPADGQFVKVVDYVDEEEKVVIAGDVNLRPPFAQLDGKGFSEPLADSIDQVLVRGMPSSPPAAWRAERRRVGGRLVSDHAPVELTIG
jgi:endonuclease/exonuclease/phosphatase family metal-dependent hydrolase